MIGSRGAVDIGEKTGLSGVLLRPVRGTNAFEATVEQLATAIGLGVFSDGDRLPPERELAGAMKVSRATLREAIAALRQAGLVSTRSGRGGGTVVMQSHPGADADDELARRTQARALVAADRDRYRDALVARRIVEPGAAFVAANIDLTRDQRDWLRAALHTVATADNSLLHRQADSRLHLAVATLSGSPTLLGLVADLQRDLHQMLTAIPVLAVNIAHSNDDHEAIVDAVLAGAPERARRVMESHCDASAALLRGLLGMPDMSRRNGNL
ncbi:MAG: FadR family transcriptional regulator [Propionibacteriales bacterium]|nr:FadR family transcriptional regulator [Propionibacteriales bacterium]